MPTMPTGTPPSLTSAAHDAGASRHVVWVRSHSHSTSPGDDHWPLWLTACHHLTPHLQRFGPDTALLDLGTCTDEEAVAVVQALIARLRSKEITLRAAIGSSGILAQLALLHLPHTPTHEPLTLLMAEQIPALLRQRLHGCCPHARGGEPREISNVTHPSIAVPTPVGVNRT